LGDGDEAGIAKRRFVAIGLIAEMDCARLAPI
jgi:hypothetical protein